MKMSVAMCVLLAAVQFASATQCDVSCSSFTTEAACDKSMADSCALCQYNEGSPGSCTEMDPSEICSGETCSACRTESAKSCLGLLNQVACEKVNMDTCVLCGWANGKCQQSSCSASCWHFTTKATCEAAASGACPYDCSWDSSDNLCESAQEEAVSSGLKTFVIIIIVASVLVVLGIVACIVCCCCCTGAAAASALKRDNVVNEKQAFAQHPQPYGQQ